LKYSRGIRSTVTKYQREDWRTITVFNTEFFKLDNFDLLGIGMVVAAVVAASLALVLK
jgi:hypothetical protein